MGIRRLVVSAGKLALRAFPEAARHGVAVRWRHRFPVDDLIAAEQTQDPERLDRFRFPDGGRYDFDLVEPVRAPTASPR